MATVRSLSTSRGWQITDCTIKWTDLNYSRVIRLAGPSDTAERAICLAPARPPWRAPRPFGAASW